MAELPDGIVTFLFADVEGGTRLWEEAPDSMMDALRLHDGVIGTAVAGRASRMYRESTDGTGHRTLFQKRIWSRARSMRMRIMTPVKTSDPRTPATVPSMLSYLPRAIAHVAQTVGSALLATGETHG